MAAEIIVNANSHETRVALMDNGVVTELYIERHQEQGIVGNVYKGRVTRVLPGIQTAFVDVGLKKAGFLYVSDVSRQEVLEDYAPYLDLDEEEVVVDQEREVKETGERSLPRGSQPSMPIEEMLQEGQEILVQVSKDPMGSKGCRLTTYITLAGRYLVFMPTIDHVGVSRRIEHEGERRRLKELIRQAKPAGAGYIVRTVSEGMDQEELQADMKFLGRLWNGILEGAEKAAVPCLLHHDLDLILRSIRDLFTAEVDRLAIDSPTEYERCAEFVRTYWPHLGGRIELYTDPEPIFDAFGIELEISRVLGRKVWLKSGGYIVIDQTEALVSIDVNTGRYVGKRNQEETVLKTNLEAVREIVYQLRLRNIGGIIIIDFIDMERQENRERVYNSLKDALKGDRSRTNILQISELGLVEMTRKRVRDSLDRILCQPCPCCEGRGSIKSAVTVCYEALRAIKRQAQTAIDKKKVVISVHPSVADLLFGEENAYLEELEQGLKKKIIVKADYDLHPEQFDLLFL